MAVLRHGHLHYVDSAHSQVSRLEQAFEMLEAPAKAEPCAGMRGIIEEGDEHAGEDYEEDGLRDAAIIGAAQRVEHYEIAAYGTSAAHAKLLGLDEVVELLEATLQEEKATDEKLTAIAESVVNVDAASAENDDEESDEEEEAVGAGAGGRRNGGTSSARRGAQSSATGSRGLPGGRRRLAEAIDDWATRGWYRRQPRCATKRRVPVAEQVPGEATAKGGSRAIHSIVSWRDVDDRRGVVGARADRREPTDSTDAKEAANPAGLADRKERGYT